jgi:hypothetical protein
VSRFSNKSWLQNFMIDSKVFFYDIFYDTSVNFISTYPLLYTAGMCDVTYIGVYTYLHGKCFLSALYNDIIWLALPQSTLLFVSSSDSSSHAYATSRSNLLRIDRRHTFYRNTAYSMFACAVAFLWKASAANVLLPVDWAGMQLDLVCPVKCH